MCSPFASAVLFLCTGEVQNHAKTKEVLIVSFVVAFVVFVAIVVVPLLIN